MNESTSPEPNDSTKQAVLDVLRRIERRHSDPSNWCVGAFARGKTRRVVKPLGQAVVSTCLEGARLIESRGLTNDASSAVIDAIQAACSELYPRHGTLSVNDEKGYEAVRAVERKAVEIVEAQS